MNQTLPGSKIHRWKCPRCGMFEESYLTFNRSIVVCRRCLEFLNEAKFERASVEDFRKMFPEWVLVSWHAVQRKSLRADLLGRARQISDHDAALCSANMRSSLSFAAFAHACQRGSCVATP